MWQYFVQFYERFLFLPRPRFYLNLIYIFSPFSVLLIYLSCFGFSYTEYHGPTYCIPNSTGDILLSNDNHEKSFQEFKQHPQAFKYSISQPKDEFWQRCQIYGVCGCIVVLGPPMQKKVTTPPDSSDQSNGKMEETHFIAYIFCLSNSEKKN